MFSAQEIFNAISPSRRTDLLSGPACRDTEKNLEDYLLHKQLIGEKLTPDWILVSTGSDFTRPTAVAQAIQKHEPFGNDTSIITYCAQTPVLEGMIVRQYKAKTTPYNWYRPKRPLFSATELPSNFEYESEVVTIETLSSLIMALGCYIGPRFVENVHIASEWLTTNHPKLVHIIWEGYFVRDIDRMR